MPHQDHGQRSEAPAISSALDWLVVPRTFQRQSFRRNCSWSPSSLVQAALVWAWGEETALTDRYVAARQTIARLPAGQCESVSYQAFVKLLKRHSTLLLLALMTSFRRRMRQSLPRSYRVAGYLAFGVDGTRIDAPRTAANERAFGASRCRTRQRGRRRRAARKKAAAPRLWLTTLWHVGSGLPWDWTDGPSDAGERSHALELLQGLPERSLLLADAGFVGYDFWTALQQAGHDFVIRVGANVTLLKQLGWFRENAGRVYLWPDNQAHRGRPPIVLRLVVSHDGKHPVYLVTSVLAKQALSDRQLIELYRARWGVEVFYRSFKRTFGRHKLRSGTPDNARLELDWSLAALWGACLYAKRQQTQEGEDVSRTSVATVLRILRLALREAVFPLVKRLAAALVDDYQRTSKASRDYPVKKKDPPGTSPPRILRANKKQVENAKAIKRLTA